MDSRNPNFIPLTNGGNTMPTSSPAATSSPPISLLHPSWMAKMKERQQTTAINAFQGKRMVFD